MKNHFKLLSIIIPVYNEKLYIVKVLETIINVPLLQLNKEIIIVDDNSTDGTLQQIKDFILKNNHRIILIKKSENEGKGAAVKTGILQSKGDIVLVQDADLEYNPSDYPNLLEPFFNQNADVVYGSRFISHKPHRVLYFWHYVGNVALTMLSNMFTNLNLSDIETGYKAFRGDIIRNIAPHLKSKRFGFEPEITARLAKIKNIKIYEVGISYQGRTYNEGKKIGWKDGLSALVEIIRYNIFK